MAYTQLLSFGMGEYMGFWSFGNMGNILVVVLVGTLGIHAGQVAWDKQLLEYFADPVYVDNRLDVPYHNVVSAVIAVFVG